MKLHAPKSHGNAVRHDTTPISTSTDKESSPSLFRCRMGTCSATFSDKHKLHLHRMREHFQSGGALHPRPWADNEAPWEGENANTDEDFRDVYEANAPLILESHQINPIQSVYNFPLNNMLTVDELMEYAEEIFRQQQHAFRLNLVFGTILRNRETGQYRYFVAYNNNGIFEKPLYISKRSDLNRLHLRLSNMDITTELLRQRPDTKWIPILVSNVHFTVYSTHYPIGQGGLPDYLMTKDSLYALVKNRHTGRYYNDFFCSFRCVALHRGHDIKRLEVVTREYYQEWCKHMPSATNNFQGVDFDQLPDFEKVFDLNIEVYDLKEDGFAQSIYRSRGLHGTTMYVNLFENHMSYINNFAQYAQKFQCKTCERHFKLAGDLYRHQRNCANQTKFVYPGGFHRANESIFTKLEQFDINVPEDDRTFPWFICYDFEAILQKVDDHPSQFLQWTQEHKPISVSICSNVHGHTEPFCIVEPDQDNLVEKMVTALQEIAMNVYELSENTWGWVLKKINDKLEEEKRKETQSGDEAVHFDDDEDENDDDNDVKNGKIHKFNHPLQKLYGEMEAYMRQVPVLGFNSAKYDLNLVKQCLAKHLNMHNNELRGNFVVKKSNSYACIATQQLKFLDISQFLAAGASYSSFLKAYHIQENKGFFPYSYFDDVAKLEETSLPPHGAFYSSLKGTNISKQEYEYCQKVWTELNMTTFRDFLIWYNNLDVSPFVKAVTSLQEFYFKQNIDVFKTSISVPGIARQLLFRTAKENNANFALCDKHNADLYQTIKQNIVGGPSIIFTRHHIAGETRIRGQKLCGAILGYDSNALYLEAIGRAMPVGPFVRRLSENNFRPQVRDRFMSAYYWMDWLIHITGVPIQHRLNHGSEVRVGSYPVDGFSPATSPHEKPTCYQFQGCYWHGHYCDVTKNVKDKKWWATRQQKFMKTQETSQYLKDQGYELEEMWECQFLDYCRQNPQIFSFIDSRRPGFFQHYKGAITTDTILEGVVQNKLFGMVEVDIEVPEQWPSHFQHPTYTPYQYFEEMSPLFCNTDVPFEAIGTHMQQHVNQHNLSKSPRRLLIGGMKGRQMLIATPLLKWYLNHGMVVTKIYQLIEYQDKRCFKKFVKEVSDARRTGDIDPDTAIIADTMKVIGNSGFGSLIMDKTKHREITYVQGENETCLKINDPRFRKLECLQMEEQFYEMEMAKRKIKLDLPIQLGFFILQYAKLRMLEFYYDFMDTYVDRSDFEYCEMDTDSAYMAISGSTLNDIIKPEMRNKYMAGLTGFCNDEDLEADADYHWFPRTCCNKHAKYDKRTPGLFKLEYEGHEMIGLCSKTYIVRKTKTVYPSSTRQRAYKLLRLYKQLKYRKPITRPRLQHEYKFSSKGISKRNIKTPMAIFRRVLKTGSSSSGINRGFRVRNNTIFTYTQERRGFAYFYCKRRVLGDGIHTKPLDITVCPIPQTPLSTIDQTNIDILVDLLDSNN